MLLFTLSTRKTFPITILVASVAFRNCVAQICTNKSVRDLCTVQIKLIIIFAVHTRIIPLTFSWTRQNRKSLMVSKETPHQHFHKHGTVMCTRVLPKFLIVSSSKRIVSSSKNMEMWRFPPKDLHDLTDLIWEKFIP